MVNQSWPRRLAPGVVDREDVRVLQPGRRPDLAQEPLGAEAAGERGEEDLEGDGAVVPEVAGQVDDGHAAAAELALEHVPIPQRLLEVVARFGGGHDGERDGGGGRRMGCKLSARCGASHGRAKAASMRALGPALRSDPAIGTLARCSRAP